MEVGQRINTEYRNFDDFEYFQLNVCQEPTMAKSVKPDSSASNDAHSEVSSRSFSIALDSPALKCTTPILIEVYLNRIVELRTELHLLCCTVL